MSERDGSIQMDEPTAEFDPTAAFLSLLKKDDPEGLSDNEAEAPEEDAETAPTEEDDKPAAEDGATDDATKTTDPEDPEFDVKVGDQTHKAKLSELKRLFGQEAALTQKSQKLADDLRVATENRTVATNRLTTLVANAEAAYKPYAELDMLVLSQRMDTNEFAQLRQDAALSKSNLEFLQREQSSVLRETSEAAQRSYVEASRACVTALENPTTGIPGFGKDMYEQLSTFSRDQGFDGFHAITNPSAIKLIHKAMEYDKMQKAAKSAELKTKKVVHTATKVARPGASPTTSDTGDFASAMKRLRESGSQDAATAAFAAMDRRSS